MKNENTPACDGLPVEFYQTFWSIHSCYDSGTLSNLQRLGIISLLYNKWDATDPDNWRPTIVDYKILSKTLANRLLLVIGNVVNPDQTCGVPKRFIGEYVALVRDIIEYRQSANLPGIIISLNKKKGFWSRRMMSPTQSVESKGCGPTFLRCIKLIYTNVVSQLNINGFLTGPFLVGRGVRQGFPLSLLLYILSAEPLACAIWNSSSIVGFPLPRSGRKTAKLSQYADGTTVILVPVERGLI